MSTVESRPITESRLGIRPIATSLLLNLSEPSQVALAAALDVEGVGLLRAELNIDVVDRTRRLIDAAERRVLLEAARGRAEQ